MVLYLPSYRVELKNEEIILLLYNSVIWVKCQAVQFCWKPRRTDKKISNQFNPLKGGGASLIIT